MDIIDAYVALWNEPDPARRREGIRRLWTADGVHLLQPPEAVRALAAGLGFGDTALEARGYAALEARVSRAYAEFVAPGRFAFRSRGDGERLRDVVKFRWEMVPVGGGAVAGVGLEVLLLAPDGRIAADHQFIEA